jgi:flagellar basal body-associated protein FliL
MISMLSMVMIMLVIVMISRMIMISMMMIMLNIRKMIMMENGGADEEHNHDNDGADSLYVVDGYDDANVNHTGNLRRTYVASTTLCPLEY